MPVDVRARAHGLLVLAALAVASLARADDKAACNEAFDQAQMRRDEGKLLESRRLLRVCSRPTCTSTQQTLCSEMLGDVEARLPSLIPSARDGTGAELVDVSVLLDGVPVATTINGRAIDVDPGLHTVVFERTDGTRLETKALAAERGKGKVVSVTFGQPTLPVGAPPPPFPPPPPVAPAYSLRPPPPPRPSDAPPAYDGFQVMARTGAQFPLGQATGAPNDSMGNTFSWQVPIAGDIGWKPTPSWFVGLYFGLGFGAPGSVISQACSSHSESCFSSTARIGLETLYYLSPASAVNPWLGYGVGYEQSSVSIGASGGGSASVSAKGWEFGHLMAGLDFRLSQVIGIGPMVDLSFGQYGTLAVNTGGTDSSGTYVQTGSASGSITQTALHEWLLVGGRMVFFP
jgi:hypothetical protein